MSIDRPSSGSGDDPQPRAEQPPGKRPDQSGTAGGDATGGQHQTAGDDRSRREQAREARSRFQAHRTANQDGGDTSRPGQDSRAAGKSEQPDNTQRQDPHQARRSGAPDLRSGEQTDTEHLHGTSPADRTSIAKPESPGTTPDVGSPVPDSRVERISQQLRDQGRAAEGTTGPRGEYGNAPAAGGGDEPGRSVGDDDRSASWNKAESLSADAAGEGQSPADRPREGQTGEIRVARHGDSAPAPPEPSQPGHDMPEKQDAGGRNPPDADNDASGQEVAHRDKQERQPAARPYSGESGSPDIGADRNPDSDPPGESRADTPRQYLDKLANLEQWLEDKQLPYALFGSLAASAYIDQGRSLDFNRPHAHEPTERVPDIDLLVPRASLERIKPYIDDVRHSDFPVKIDTFWAESWIDLRPDAEYSYLTHREVRLPVRTELFSPCKAQLLGQEITTLDPRTLLGLYGTVGVLRKQDVPRITGLIKAIASGAAPSRFTEQDCKVFDDFMHARKRRYPVFMASKRAWVGLLDTLPPPASRALKHHVQLRANEVFRTMNRRQGREPDQPDR
jgi:hypothetical protein